MRLKSPAPDQHSFACIHQKKIGNVVKSDSQAKAQPLRLTTTRHTTQTVSQRPSTENTNPMPANVKTRIMFHSKRLNIYLVRYPEGHKVLPHVDMISEGRLYKLNCVLIKPKTGGEFICDKNIFNLFGRLYLFRPDLYQHQVSKILHGNRWLLSFALMKPPKNFGTKKRSSR